MEEEEDEGEKDLVGFLRMTVIDTSFKIWKLEKLVFRRRNIWKVRDKNGNSRGVVSSRKRKIKKKTIKNKKKRKCDVFDDEIGRKSKKMKFSRSVSDNVSTKYYVCLISLVFDSPAVTELNK